MRGVILDQKIINSAKDFFDIELKKVYKEEEIKWVDDNNLDLSNDKPGEFLYVHGTNGFFVPNIAANVSKDSKNIKFFNVGVTIEDIEEIEV